MENRDLIEPIVNQVNERADRDVATIFLWTKGHAGNAGNEAADRLAVAGSAMDPSLPYVVPKFGIDETEYGEGMLAEELAGLTTPDLSEADEEEVPKVYSELLAEAAVDEQSSVQNPLKPENGERIARTREATEEL